MEDKDSAQLKKALKGICSGTNLKFEDFADVLYNNSKVMREQTRLKRDLKKSIVHMQKEQKRALSSVYFKMKVSDDFLSCSPHTDQNGDYM